MHVVRFEINKKKIFNEKIVVAPIVFWNIQKQTRT